MQLENLEHRRLLAGDIELVIGMGNIPSSQRPQLDAEILLTELENEDDPRDERITNDTPETAQFIPLGFDVGEYEAIDLRGELIEPSNIATGISRETAQPNAVPPIPAVDDGSIPTATPVNHGSGAPIAFEAQLGNAVGFPNDADFYELEGLEAGQRITAHMAGGPHSVLVLYNVFGEVLEISEATPTVENYIAHIVPEDGDYYFAAIPFNPAAPAPFDGPSDDFELPRDPNNSATVTEPGPGAQDYTITIGADAVDVDYYSFELEPGDILGVSGIGTDVLIMENSAGDTLLQSGLDELDLFPPFNSPLPGGNDTASLSYVIDEPGTYFVSVHGFRFNPYKMEMRLFRPAIESQPVGAEQIVFLDFDGAELNNSLWLDTLNADLIQLSPFSRYIRNFGLSDESDLINRIVRNVTSHYEGLKEYNPDASIRFLNSRDHVDPFGQENVSRVIIGGTSAELGLQGIFGIAESVDVGNFDLSETAVVLMDLLSGPSNDPNSLNHYPIAPGASKAEFVARGIGTIVSHELAHILGARHSDRNSDVVSIGDEGGTAGWIEYGLGSDRTFGTHDDIEPEFKNDVFSRTEGRSGHDNVASMLANVLTRGRGAEGSTPRRDISGIVFDDRNGNGVQDAGELGIAGARVYVDENRDQEFGIGEYAILTDSTGHYAISNAGADGETEVRVAYGAGFLQTSPEGGGYVIEPNGDPLENADFGIQLPAGELGGIDYGDAPESYGIASHLVVPGFSLGETVDGEEAPPLNDGSDDDGVMLSAVSVGMVGTAEITVTVSDFSPGVVNGWIDFNRDGFFASEEQIVRDLLVEDAATVNFSVPEDAVLGASWARFRYGYTRGIGPAGAGKAGEVEDYALQITDSDGGNLGPIAIDDDYEVAQDAGATEFNVLLNDDAGSGDITITSVSLGNQGGLVSIAGDGQSIFYTPQAGFSGQESFTYSVSSIFGSDTAVVTVDVTPDGGGDDMLVRFRLETAGTDGTPIDSVAAGGDFVLNVYAQDLRADGVGVFAGYLDVEFNGNLAAANGNVTFGDTYPAGQEPPGGVVVGSGEFDEYGAFAGQTNDLGNEELLLYSVPMRAGTSSGQLVFSSNPADILPLHEVLLGDISQPIPPARIDYTSTTLTVGGTVAAAFTNPNNRFDVDNNGFVTPRDALLLINDINESGARELTASGAPISTGYYLDVSADGNLSAIDVLQVINEINRAAAVESPAVAAAAAVDAVFDADLDDDEDDDLWPIV